MTDIKFDNQKKCFIEAVQGQDTNQVLSKADTFIAAFNPAKSDSQTQMSQLKAHLKGRAKEATGQVKKDIQKEIKKIENISKALVFYKEMEKEYGEKVANEVVNRDNNVRGDSLSYEKMKELETDCKIKFMKEKGITLKTQNGQDVNKASVARRSKKDLVLGANDKILNDFKEVYGFEAVKLAMRHCYTEQQRKAMGKGEECIDPQGLHDKILENERGIKSSLEGIKDALKDEDNPTFWDGKARSSLLNLAMKDKKVQAAYAKIDTGVYDVETEAIACCKRYAENLREYVKGVNQASDSSQVTAQDVLQAAYNIGGESLVLKLLNNKRMSRSEQQRILNTAKASRFEQNQQQTAQILNHLLQVKIHMNPIDAAKVTLEKMKEVAEELGKDLNKLKLSEQDYIDIADAINDRK